MHCSRSQNVHTTNLWFFRKLPWTSVCGVSFIDDVFGMHCDENMIFWWNSRIRFHSHRHLKTCDVIKHVISLMVPLNNWPVWEDVWIPVPSSSCNFFFYRCRFCASSDWCYLYFTRIMHILPSHPCSKWPLACLYWLWDECSQIFS